MLLFAVGIYELSKHDRRKGMIGREKLTASILKARWILPAAALLFVIHNGLVGVSNFYAMFGQFEKDTALSRQYFDTALNLNPENGGAYFMSGIRDYLEADPDRALPMLTNARRYGAAATVNYYYAASSKLLKNDTQSAAELMSEAVATYPGSVYARVHYSILLAKTGRNEEAERQYETAFELNKRQAETWRLILEDGILNATDNVRRRQDIDLPYKLEPENIIRSILFLSKHKKSRK